MTQRAVAVTILSALALLPRRPRAERRPPSPRSSSCSRSAGEYVLGYEDSFRVVVAEEVYVQRLRASPSGPVQRDAPPELRRRLRPRPRHGPALVAAARRLRGGRPRGAGPAGASREAPGRRAGRRPRAGAGDRRRGRPLQPRPQPPELQRADPRARLPPPLRAAAVLVREEGNGHDRGAHVRRARLPGALGPHRHPRPRLAPGRARHGPGVGPRRDGRHGGPHRARPGPARGRRHDPRDPHHGVPALPAARPLGPGRDAGPPPDRARRRARPVAAASRSSRASPPTAPSARPGSARRRSSACPRPVPVDRGRHRAPAGTPAPASAGLAPDARECFSKSRTSVSSIRGSSPVKTPTQARSCGRIRAPQ